MNRKGSAINIFLFVVIAFTIAITTIIGYYVVNDNMLPQIQPIIGGDSVVNDTLNTYQSSLAALDYMLFAIFIGLIIMSLIAAMLTRVHPAFLFFYVILVIVAIIVSVPLSNSYQTIEATLGTASSFTISSFVMGQLPLFTAVVGVLILIITFVSVSGGGKGT